MNHKQNKQKDTLCMPHLGKSKESEGGGREIERDGGGALCEIQ